MNKKLLSLLLLLPFFTDCVQADTPEEILGATQRCTNLAEAYAKIYFLEQKEEDREKSLTELAQEVSTELMESSRQNISLAYIRMTQKIEFMLQDKEFKQLYEKADPTLRNKLDRELKKVKQEYKNHANPDLRKARSMCERFYYAREQIQRDENTRYHYNGREVSPEEHSRLSAQSKCDAIVSKLNRSMGPQQALNFYDRFIGGVNEESNRRQWDHPFSPMGDFQRCYNNADEATQENINREIKQINEKIAQHRAEMKKRMEESKASQ
jgi:hypothetical protein